MKVTAHWTPSEPVVPLLHLYGEYRWTDELALVLDVEGLAAPQGRAITP